MFASLLLAALTIAASDVETATEAELSKQVDAAFIADDWTAYARLAEVYLRRFPEEKYVKVVVERIADVWRQKKELELIPNATEREKLLDAIRRITREHPNSIFEESNPIVARFLDHDRAYFFGGAFSNVGPILIGRDGGLSVDRHTGSPSTYTAYQIPLDAFQEKLRSLPVESSSVWKTVLQVDRSKWKPVGKARVEFPTKPPDPNESWIRPERKVAPIKVVEPGPYVIDEEIEGFHKHHYVDARSFYFYSKAIGGKGFVFAVDPITSRPLSEIQIKVRTKDKLFEGTTDANGLLPLSLMEDAIIEVRRGNEFQADFFQYRDEPNEWLTFISTDRTIYRPSQTVHFKVVARKRSNVKHSSPTEKSIPIEIRDDNGRIVHRQDCAWSEFGTTTGSFQLGDEPRLGSYWVVVPQTREDRFDSDQPWDRLRGDDPAETHWRKQFFVAAYRKPELQISLERSAEAISGYSRPRARIRMTVKDYFGRPVVGADISWSLIKAAEDRSYTRMQSRNNEDYERAGRIPLRDGRHEWFSVDDRDNDDDTPSQLTRYDSDGEGKTNAEGVFLLEFTSEKHDPEGEYIVEATVDDGKGSMGRLDGRVEYYPSADPIVMRIFTDRGFYQSPEPINAFVVVTGKEIPLANRTVHLVATLWDAANKDESRPAFDGVAQTDKDGVASFRVPVPRGVDGRLALTAMIRQENRQIETTTSDYFLFDDIASASARMVADRQVYEPGETARILVPPRIGQGASLLTVESNAVHFVDTIADSNKPRIVEVPLKPDWGSDVCVLLTCWANGAPDYKRVQCRTLMIAPIEQFVDVGVAVDREQYSPRQKARVRVTTESQGKPVTAEVELGFVDAKIFELAADRTRDIRRFFFPPRGPHISHSYFGPAEWYADIDDSELTARRERRRGGGFGFGGGGGGGFGGPGAFAVTEVRSNFPDTWFWSGSVVTGADGKAAVELDVPDSLTRWRVVARAVTKDHKFGHALSYVITTKPVSIELAAPRFYNEGDRGVIGATLRNDLDVAEEFVVRFHASQGMEAAAESKIKLEPKSQQNLQWPVSVKQEGELVLRAEALSKTASDAVEIKVPVHPFAVVVPVTLSGVVRESWLASLELPDDAIGGTLEVVVSDVPGAIRDALPYLAHYPYGCVEQTMSRFFPAVVAMRAFRRLDIDAGKLEESLPKMVNQGLQRLYGFQQDDGGWGWWQQNKSNPEMTAYVLYGLLQAKAAGVSVDALTIERGLKWLRENSKSPFSLYVRTLAGEKDIELSKATFESRIERAYLVLAGRKDLAADLPSMEMTDAKSIAVVVMALASVDRKDERLGPLLEALMLGRRGTAWTSTIETAYAVLALAEICEGEGKQVVEVRINDAVAEPDSSGRYRLAAPKKGNNIVHVKRLSGSVPYASARLEFRSKNWGQRRRFPFLAPRNQPIEVTRRFLVVQKKGDQEDYRELESGDEIKVGDVVEVELDVKSDVDYKQVLLECPLPAGCEGFLDNAEFAEGWTGRYCRQELRDNRAAFAIEDLDAHNGNNDRIYDLRLRAMLPGEYRVLPASALPMYSPDDRSNGSAFVLRIKNAK